MAAHAAAEAAHSRRRAAVAGRAHRCAPVGVLLIEHPAADTAISVISGVLLLVILARFGWLYVRWRRYG